MNYESLRLDPIAEAKKLRHIAPPTAVPDMFHGPVGQWVLDLGKQSEASPVAMFANFIVYLGICFGREAYLWLGDDQHHPRIFHLHVGRTNRGRKGTAVSPIRRLIKSMTEIDNAAEQLTSPENKPDRIVPNHHTGGLSSREGLAWSIRDPVEEWDEESGEHVIVDPGVTDKRLFVVESEFANILAQSGRRGNTLSPALRDCFDGIDLAPLTKHERTRASAPHVGLIAHTTPSELFALVKDTQIYNGFLNRFLVTWAEKTQDIPFPEPTEERTIATWADHVQEATVWVRKHKPEMHLSDEAKNLYSEAYTGEWSPGHSSELIESLMERVAPVSLRLAMTLAILDKTESISADHIGCAIAWTRYWRASVEYIWRDRVRLSEGNSVAQDVVDNAKKILAFLRKEGDPVSRTTLIHACFKGNCSASEINAALKFLRLQTTPLIEVQEVPTKKGRNGRQYTTRVISLTDSGKTHHL